MDRTAAVRQIESKPGVEWSCDEQQIVLDWLGTDRYQALYRCAYSVAGNEDDAADAVLDTFARYRQIVKTYHPARGTGFYNYFLTCVRNAASKIAKKRGAEIGRRVALTDDGTYEREVQCDEPGGGDPACIVMEQEEHSPRRECTVRAFARLREENPRQAQAVAMRSRAVPDAQIAATMGVTNENARQLISRGHERMRGYAREWGYLPAQAPVPTRARR